MSLQHFNDFLADLRTINPKINIDRKRGRKTSALGLITQLRSTANNPQPIQSVPAARSYCRNPNDARLNKYVPAIRRLISVWGHGDDDYPYIELNFAQFNHRRLLGGIPANVGKPSFDTIQVFEDDPFLLHAEARTTYLKTLTLENGSRLDITARSLLLCAGLLPPLAIATDNGYLNKLALTPDNLKRMAGHSILDVACGAAIFRAEMEALFGCTTTGLDLNAADIDAEALDAGKERYTKSMLYLKMLSALHKLQVVDVSAEWDWVIDLAVENFAGILTSYEENPPDEGDVFELAEDDRRWDYVTSTFLLCYFDRQQQTDAIRNMCSVARNAVFVTTGGSRATKSPDLDYDEAAIRSAFPRCRIEVKSSEAHHIFLR
jgi:hypothetical protein